MTAEPNIASVLRADHVRSLVNHGLIGVGFPLIGLIAIVGEVAVALFLGCVGCVVIFGLERWTGEKLRRYLVATGQSLPEWLQRPYIMTRRIVLESHSHDAR